MRKNFPLAPFILTFGLTLSSEASAQETTFNYHVRIDSDKHHLMVRDSTPCIRITGGVVVNDACVGGWIYTYRAVNTNEQVSGAASINRDAKEDSRLLVNFYTFHCGGTSVDLSDEENRASAACKAEVARINARQYAITFANRTSAEFWSYGGQLKLITIPLKARLGYASDTVQVASRAEASVNGNLFAGYRIGREKYFYERGATRNPYTRYHITPGGFIGASVVTVGSATSRTAKVPETSDIPTAVISGGLGVMAGVRNFSLGAFVGWDHAWGEVGKNWDFQHRRFFGIGITLDSFWDGARL